MYDTTTLKQGLRKLKKGDLAVLGKNHGIASAYQMKKEDLIIALNDLLPKKFAEDIIYFSSNEMMLYSDGFRQMFEGLDHDLLKQSLDKMKDDNLIPDVFGDKNENISVEEVFKTFDLMKKMVVDDDINNLNYLINMGYAFPVTKDYYTTVKLPSELKEVFKNTMEKRGDEIFDYQSLQLYIFSLSNLYGVCSYHQLHKVYKKLTGSSMTLKKVRDYVLKFSEKDALCAATDNYLYNTVLKEEEYELIVDSDLNRDYYFPTEAELSAYGYGFFRPQAIKIYEELKETILNHSKIEDFFDEEFVSYADALELEDEDILDSFEFIFDEIMFSAKMGYGLYDLIKVLDNEACKFDSLKDMNHAYSLYLQLQETARKWPLKGALFSEL
ncbi:MAG: hypothetical protein ACLFQE_07255 [Thermotogota bacterium]